MGTGYVYVWGEIAAALSELFNPNSPLKRVTAMATVSSE